MKVKHCSCPGPRYSNLVDLCGTQEWGVFIIRRLLGILRFQYHSAWTWKTLWFLPESSHVVKLKTLLETLLVVQWLRIHLPMQETWVQPLVWEDPMCHGATKLVCHNYWAGALQPANLWQEKPPQRDCHALQLESSPCSPQLEKDHVWPTINT